MKVLLHDEEVLSVLKDVEHSDDVWMPCIHQHFELVYKQVVESRLLA